MSCTSPFIRPSRSRLRFCLRGAWMHSDTITITFYKELNCSVIDGQMRLQFFSRSIYLTTTHIVQALITANFLSQRLRHWGLKVGVCKLFLLDKYTLFTKSCSWNEYLHTAFWSAALLQDLSGRKYINCRSCHYETSDVTWPCSNFLSTHSNLHYIGTNDIRSYTVRVHVAQIDGNRFKDWVCVWQLVTYI